MTRKEGDAWAERGGKAESFVMAVPSGRYLSIISVQGQQLYKIG